MYAYRFCLLFLYFYNFGKTYGTEPQQQANTVVTYELKKLEEHGHTDVNKYDYGVSKFVFNPTGHKTVNKVVYDGASLWPQETTDGKAFKQLEAYEKDNVLQLVHLKLAKDTVEEDLYYKKVKNSFMKLSGVDQYNELKDKLLNQRRETVDQFFPLDLHKKDLYSRFYNEKQELYDGVWRRTLTPTKGKAYLARDGTDNLWDLATEHKQLYTVKEFGFGDDGKLLELTLHGGVYKYFHKLGAATTWTPFASTSEFDTKVSELKSKFFDTAHEYDLAQKPDLSKFVLQLRSDVGNANDLTLMPVKNYFVNKVKFNDQVLWESNNKTERVFRMRLFLLGYEVMMAQLLVAKNPTSVEFTPQVLYFHKQNGAFKKLEKKKEYEEALKKVKSLADRTKPFVYRNDWVAKDARLDLSRYNLADWTVATEDLTNGLKKVTLTAKEGYTFTSLLYLGQVVLPNQRRSHTDPLVKVLDLYYKKGLLQLVHVNGTWTVTTNDNSVNQPFDLYLKKVKDDLVDLEKTKFDEHVNSLKQVDHLVDNNVHLDLNDDDVLNNSFYNVTEEYLDGAMTRVVKSNTLRVTRLTHNNFEFWKQTGESPDKYVTQYELYTVDDAKLLAVRFNTGGSSRATSAYFEKRNNYTEWAEFTDRTFNDALTQYKGVANWQNVELNLAVKPMTNLFEVTVNPLRGNRTELVLKPLENKRLTHVKVNTERLWEANVFNRAYRVHVYLEAYEAKFVVVDYVSDRLHVKTTAEKKFWKDGNVFRSNHLFDEKLTAFKTQDNRVEFTYNPNWSTPLTDFDPAAFNATDFDVTTAVDGALESKKYVPKAGTLVKKVTFHGAKVWPMTDEENTTRKLVYLEVFSKDGLVQLLVLHNKLLEGDATPEDLYFKKVKNVYESVELTVFTELKNSLATPNKYVDDNVSLDLSTEVSTELFKTESTLEDGLEKEVLELKVGRLYEVKASPALWTSTDGSYVTKLEKYTLNDSQLLVLHVTKTDGTVEKQYFEKTLTPAAAEPAVGTTSAQQATDVSTGQPVQQQEGQEQRAQEAGAAGVGAGVGAATGAEATTQQVTPAAPKPSFHSMTDKSAFFTKLNQAKQTLTHTDVTLNLNAYNDNTKFRVLQSAHGTATLYKLFPLATYRVTRLDNGNTKLWEKEAEGDRMVETWVYLHDAKVKFVYGLVWPNDRVDESKDKALYFQLNLQTNAFETKTMEEFVKALEATTTVAPEPLPVASGGVLPPKTREYRKLFLAENVDPLLFDATKETRGEYTLRTFAAKLNVFVNLLETEHGVLWKANQTTDLWKNATFALKNDAGHADLTLSENDVEKHLYFKFENNGWKNVKVEEYNTLNANVPVANAGNSAGNAGTSGNGEGRTNGYVV